MKYWYFIHVSARVPRDWTGKYTSDLNHEISIFNSYLIRFYVKTSVQSNPRRCWTRFALHAGRN